MSSLPHPAPAQAPEPAGSPKFCLQYEKLQSSSFVTSAVVARFTDVLVPQLVVFKEVTMEVWEVEETRQSKVFSTVLERPVTHCCVLETSKVIATFQGAPSAFLHLDLLLVTDGLGAFTICQWNEILLEVQESGRANVQFSSELQSASAVLPSTPLFSCPLYLPRRASWERRPLASEAQIDTTEANDCCLGREVAGIAVIAVSLYQGLLGILHVEWTSTYPNFRKELSVLPSKPSLAPEINLHFLPVPMENAIHGPMVAFVNPCVVRDLAFLGSDEGAGYGAWDVKNRLLLLLLTSEQGLFYHSLRLQCMALNLSPFQLRPGPWEIRNLNPSTSLIVPWSFVGNLEDFVGSKSNYVETGFNPGAGVLAISSAGVMFVEASGRRALLPLHLDGFPTCWTRLPQNCLVLGDATGALNVFDLRSWAPNIISKIVLNTPLAPIRLLLRVLSIKASGTQCSYDSIIFVTGQAGDSQLVKVIRTSGEPTEGFPLKCGGEWSGKNLVVESSAFLDSLAPVRDVIFIKEAIHCPDPFLLLACGSAPSSTVRKGSLMSTYHVDTIIEANLRGLPQLIPFHEIWGLEFHTHILVSYPIAHVSEVVTINGTKTEDHFMEGLERSRCTLAFSIMPGGWFIQITERSLRVLGNDSNSSKLRAEWKLPFPASDSQRDLRYSGMINHAVLTAEGALLVSGEAVHSVQTDCFGLPHTTAISNRPHQVSALGLCHVGDSSSHTFDDELVVIIAQWTSNTVHLLSWPSLEEIVTMDAWTAPVLSVTVGRLAMKNYLFAGTANGNLLYYTLSCSKESSNAGANLEVPKLEIPSPTVDVDVGQSQRTPRRIRNMGMISSNLEASSLPKEGVPFMLPQYTLRNGRVLRVGSSITYMKFGCFYGRGEGGVLNPEKSNSESNDESLYIWSERSLVLLPQEDFRVVVLQCQSQPVPKSTRVHTRENPHSLVAVTSDGKILCGHLDSSSKLGWQVLKVEGNAVQLAHHRSSGCIVFTTIDGVSSYLNFVHEVSMLQLLMVELECNHLPNVLTTLKMPYTICSQDAKSVECLVVSIQTLDEQKINGLLSFFDVHVNYTGLEVKYELRLLGSHHMEEPCHSLCMVDPFSETFLPCSCTMCSLKTLPVDDSWLRDVLQCLEHASKHWSQCCGDQSSDPGGLQKSADGSRGPLLALGFHGKVELVYAFVGASEACMLVVPRVAATLDAPFLPSPGTHKEFDRMIDSSDDTEERSPKSKQEVQKALSMHCELASSWASSSRINIQKLESFATPGESCVTALIPLSKGTILVAEKLQGLSVFEILADGSEIVQLSWQPCAYPLKAVIPLSDDLYMLSMHGIGCQLMERDYPAEAAYLVQERLRRDLENELLSTSEQVHDGTPQSTRLLELQRYLVTGLPRLKHVTPASWTSPACYLSCGSLSLESIPLPRMETISTMVQTIATVTATGEVGVITVSKISPSRCSSWNS